MTNDAKNTEEMENIRNGIKQIVGKGGKRAFTKKPAQMLARICRMGKVEGKAKSRCTEEIRCRLESKSSRRYWRKEERGRWVEERARALSAFCEEEANE